MKRLLSLLMLSALLLASCGSETEETGGGALESMFGSSVEEDSTLTPGETPYSEGPTEIPSDLMPNE